MVPDEDASSLELIEFALSYNGYARNGGKPSTLRPIVEPVHQQFRETGVLPEDLHLLRSALFWEQRQNRINEEMRSGPNIVGETYWKALVAKIRGVTGGAILEPPDDSP